MIIAAPVSGNSPELVGSAEIYVAAVGLSDTLQHPKAGPSTPVGGCVSVCTCDARLDEQHQVLQKNRNKLFLPDIFLMYVYVDCMMFYYSWIDAFK